MAWDEFLGLLFAKPPREVTLRPIPAEMPLNVEEEDRSPRKASRGVASFPDPPQAPGVSYLVPALIKFPEALTSVPTKHRLLLPTGVSHGVRSLSLVAAMPACPPGAAGCGDEAEGGRGPVCPGGGERASADPARRLLGRRDSSGIRLYYTATLRRFDAGIMELGLVYTPVMAIPPQEEAFVLTGYCTDKCTQLVSGAGPGAPAEAPQVGAQGGRSVALIPAPRVPLQRRHGLPVGRFALRLPPEQEPGAHVAHAAC